MRRPDITLTCGARGEGVTEPARLVPQCLDVLGEEVETGQHVLGRRDVPGFDLAPPGREQREGGRRGRRVGEDAFAADDVGAAERRRVGAP
jgi:hypothetical protein